MSTVTRGLRDGKAATTLAAFLCVGWVGSATASDFDMDIDDAVESPEFELKVEYREDTRDRAALLPEFEFTLPLRPGLQVKLGTEWLHADVGGREGAIGFSDMQLEAAWIVARDISSLGLMLQLRPEVELPTGNAALGRGSDTTRINVPLIVAWNAGAFTLAAEGGYEVEGSEARTPASVTVLLAPSNELQLGVELGTDLDCEAAVKWKLTEHLRVEAEVENDFGANDGPSTTVRIGIESRF